MKDTISIRKYKADDKEQLVEIFKRNVPQYFAESEIEDFQIYLAEKIQDYYVVILAGKVIASGGINYDKERQLAKISWDIVDTPHHLTGIGTQLLKHRLTIIANKKDIKSVIVRTSQHAFGFYEKKGFKLLERHKDYWAPGFDMYKMTLTLNAKN